MLTRTHNLAGICIGTVGKPHCQRAGRLRQSRHNFVAAALTSGIVLVHWLTDSGAHRHPSNPCSIFCWLALRRAAAARPTESAASLCRSNTLWLFSQRRRHLRCGSRLHCNNAPRGAPAANPRRRRLSLPLWSCFRPKLGRQRTVCTPLTTRGSLRLRRMPRARRREPEPERAAAAAGAGGGRKRARRGGGGGDGASARAGAAGGRRSSRPSLQPLSVSPRAPDLLSDLLSAISPIAGKQRSELSQKLSERASMMRR